jgi:hypothetical protein
MRLLTLMIKESDILVAIDYSLDPSDRYYAAPLENDMFEW